MAYFRCKFNEPPEPPINYLYNWDFTQSLTDKIAKKPATLYEGASRNSNGVNFTDKFQQIMIKDICDLRGKTIEVDMGEVNYKGGSISTTTQFIQVPIFDNSGSNHSRTRGYSLLAYNGSNACWSSYGSAEGFNSLNSRQWANAYSQDLSGATTDVMNAFSNKTIKLVISSEGNEIELYLDGIYKGKVAGVYAVNNHKELAFCNSNDYYKTSTSQAKFYDAIIKALRIYETPA